MTSPVLNLNPMLGSAEGIEPILEVVSLILKDSLNSKIAEVTAEWAGLVDVDLPYPEPTAFSITNDEDNFPADIDTFPYILIMGFDDVPEDAAIEQPDADVYRYSLALRIWMRSNTPGDLTRQIYRYGEAVKRTLKKYATGAVDTAGNPSVTWVLDGITGRYSSVSPTSPYFMAAQIECRIRCWREW